MAYWICPQCKNRLYGRSTQVRIGCAKGYGECPFCRISLRVRLPVMSLILGFTGWLGVLIHSFYSDKLIPDLFTSISGLSIDSNTVLFVCSNLQLPWLILGYRYDSAKTET